MSIYQIQGFIYLPDSDTYIAARETRQVDRLENAGQQLIEMADSCPACTRFVVSREPGAAITPMAETTE